jgi:hypothetical protein
MLADVESVVARVKQSRIYRSAALVMMLWGVVNLVRDGLIALAPQWFGSRWFLIDAASPARSLSSVVARPPARALRCECWRRFCSSTFSAGSGPTFSAPSDLAN